MYRTPYRYVADFTLAHLHPVRYSAIVMVTTSNANADAQLSWSTSIGCAHYHDARLRSARASRVSDATPHLETRKERNARIGRTRGWATKRAARVRLKLGLAGGTRITDAHLDAAGEQRGDGVDLFDVSRAADAIGVNDVAREDAAAAVNTSSIDDDAHQSCVNRERTPAGPHHSPPPGIA